MQNAPVAFCNSFDRQYATVNFWFLGYRRDHMDTTSSSCALCMPVANGEPAHVPSLLASANKY